MKCLTGILAIGSLFLTPHVAGAQESVNDVLSFLLTNQAVRTEAFVKDQEATAATRDTVTRFLLVELATLPIESSAPGFIYKLNPAVASFERVSEGFGPFFVERALTSGRGQTSLGFTYRYSRFDTLDGRQLRDGSLVTTANRFTDEPDPFDVEKLALRIDASTFTLFGTHGLTDRLDVGVAIPLVALDVSGERINYYRGDVFLQARASASVVGLADIGLRAKYNVVQTKSVAIAGDMDVRLPTGAEKNLLGSGRAGLRLAALGSFEHGRLGSYFKGGLGTGGVSDEVNYGGALVFAVTPRASVVGELFGRRLDARARIGEVTAPHPLSAGVVTTRLLPRSMDAATLMAVTGFKWNISTTWVVTANVLMPLSDTGLTARVTPAISVDYTIGR